MIERAQGALPGRKAKSRKSAAKKVLSSLGSGKSSAGASKPSKKDFVATVAGGVGIAAAAKRRFGGKGDEAPSTALVHPVEASHAEGSAVQLTASRFTRKNEETVQIPKEQISADAA
ncbi:MAG: hypothetical protein ACR2QA_07580 [Solirubrobacteraceae bacterium]